MSTKMERDLEQSHKSFKTVAVAAFATIILLAGLSLSNLGTIVPVEQAETRKIELYTPPPPPPEREKVEVKEAPPLDLEIDLTLGKNQSLLVFQKIETEFSPTESMPADIDFDLSEFLDDSISHDMASLVFANYEVGQVPRGWQVRQPNFATRLKRKYPIAKFIIMVLVEQNGRPSKVHIMQSPDPDFNNKLERVILESRFATPAMKNGKHVRCWIQREYIFKSVESNSPFGA